MAWMPFAAAHAEVIGTQQAISAPSLENRVAIIAQLDRPEIAAQMQALGVDPSVVKGRVNAMTDEEVASLGQRLNDLPAGGMSHSAKVLLVLIVVGLAIWWVAGRPSM